VIHVTQLLCPQRHCFAAVAWNDDETDLATGLDELARATAILSEGDPLRLVCALCGSRDLRPEDGITRWRTREEALPHLRACELEQLFTRVAITSRPDRN
jgi:hypothetical protein